MKKLLFILLMFILSLQSYSQVLNVVHKNGSVDLFNVSDIDSITFTSHLLSTLYSPNQQVIQNKLIVHTQNQVIDFLISKIDSIYFNDAGTIAFFKTADGINQFNLSEIDSLTFSSNDDSTVYITYNDSTVHVINPWQNLGVSVAVTGADVVVTSNSGISDINYYLSGTTANGMFKIYSDKKLKLRLNGVNITNLDGPAINVQSTKNITVYLDDSTTSKLTDGVSYSTPPNSEDQKAAFFSEGQLIFWGNGSLVINGKGNDQHGLKSDDYIQVNSGNIKIASAKKDGINANDGIFINGGMINVTSTGDGIDGGENHLKITNGQITILSTSADTDALKCDSSLTITGGNLNITVQGNQSKGLNARDVLLRGGTLNIITSGGAVLVPSGSGYDPSYCTAIKADVSLEIDSCTITIQTSGIAGRGISCDGVVNIKSGSLQITSSGNGNTYTNVSGQADAYHGPCINVDSTLNIIGGQITLIHSGRAGKGISTDYKINIGSSGPETILNITTTGQRITISTNNYSEAKAISADSAITIVSGNITISSADDGIKSKQAITIEGGTVKINQSVEGIEAPNIYLNGGNVAVTASDDGLNSTYGEDGEFNDGSKLVVNGGYVFVNSTQGDALDSNGDIFIYGGTIVAHGPQSSPQVGMDVNGVCRVDGGFLVVSGTNSNMTEAPSATSTQRSVLLRTSTSINAGTLFHLEDASGNSLLTFAPIRRYYSIIFSSSELTAGTQYKVYTGGTCTGTVLNGLYTGGTYSGGTLRTTFTLTNMVQTVTF